MIRVIVDTIIKPVVRAGSQAVRSRSLGTESTLDRVNWMDPNKIGHSQEKDFANPKLRLFPHRQLRLPKTRHARGWHRIDAIITDNFFLRPELHIYHATWSGVPNFQSQHSNLISFYQLINHYVSFCDFVFEMNQSIRMHIHATICTAGGI